jgi:hypothetical protein
VSEPTRRTLRTFFQVFVGVFAITLLGWLGAVQEWAAGGRVGDLPDPGVLVDALVSAVAATAVSVVTFVQNLLEDRGTVRDLR